MPENLAREITEAIQSNCRACNGTGVEQQGGETLVSRDMALDAGDPHLEGTVYERRDTIECQYCGEQVRAAQAKLVEANTARDKRDADVRKYAGFIVHQDYEASGAYKACCEYMREEAQKILALLGGGE